ncbi:MAG: hypothetical protein K8R73_12885 [Clostridiales bacterium]|nr:hypothetical protein [Clostridiales bacterium]
MIERSLIAIDSRHTEENQIQFLKHSNPSSSLVVIFPGGDNSTDIPTLHYARKTALLIGCDVLSLQYGVKDRKLDFYDRDIYYALVEECFDAINKVNYSEYDRLFFISKSIGNSIALDVDNKYLNSKLAHIFYTPLSEEVERIRLKNCMVFTGDKDKLVDQKSIETLLSISNVEVHQFANAVHSLEINDDVGESLKILETTTNLCREYLKKQMTS